LWRYLRIGVNEKPGLARRPIPRLLAYSHIVTRYLNGRFCAMPGRRGYFSDVAATLSTTTK
jgi:hypothetical protein